MDSEKLFFSGIKEDRGWYFVDYHPPHDSTRLAILSLVIPEVTDKSKISNAMESELRAWLSRYPIPIMASAFDAADSLIHLDPVKKCNSVIGFLPKGQAAVSLNWRILEEEELPDDALDRNYLKTVYSDIPYRTSGDIQREMNKQARTIRAVKWFVFVGTVVVPLSILILPEFSRPIASIVLVYGTLKIIFRYLKQKGVIKKSPGELAKAKDELEMRHHHYHCKMNPKAFQRLKNENSELETRDRTRKEAESLKRRN